MKEIPEELYVILYRVRPNENIAGIVVGGRNDKFAVIITASRMVAVEAMERGEEEAKVFKLNPDALLRLEDIYLEPKALECDEEEEDDDA